MSDVPTAGQATRRWRVLFTPRWLSWHLFAVVAFVGMWWLGDWQFRRAISGNGLSWAYTFEWPIFAIFGAVFWVKTVRDELHPSEPPPRREIVLPAGIEGPAGTGTAEQADADRVPALAGSKLAADDDGEPDPELAEYNAYLAMLSKEVKRHGKWHGLR
ncbi:MAG TPA: hypothetical protein VN767_28885 [Streptosporangiaceae bacterium]|jgi:hypothetical protein|nr:hypothetical protein [Streptosporangiaceae bacterium]